MTCKPCEPWPVPPECCTKWCDTQAGQDLFDYWWPCIVEWAWRETCCRFGVCTLEVAPCAPCGCPGTCRCGPWQTLDMAEAFGGCPIYWENDAPQIEFRFPTDGGLEVYDWCTDGGFTVQPNMRFVDWCQPFRTCTGWPGQSCEEPWTIAAKVGMDPPGMLVKALGQFVCEIVKDCLGEESCLPDGVTSITRRGLSMDLDSASGLESTTINFDTKNTGVPLLDLAFRTWGDCGEPFAMVDTLKEVDALWQRGWSYRPVINTVPVEVVACPAPEIVRV